MWAAAAAASGGGAMRPQQAPVSGKVFIQRDYSGGTRCQFQSKFPAELENRVRRGGPAPSPPGRPRGRGPAAGTVGGGEGLGPGKACGQGPGGVRVAFRSDRAGSQGPKPLLRLSRTNPRSFPGGARGRGGRGAGVLPRVPVRGAVLPPAHPGRAVLRSHICLDVQGG